MKSGNAADKKLNLKKLTVASGQQTVLQHRIKHTT